MPLTQKLKALIPDLGQLFLRFPVASATAVILWMLLMAMLASGYRDDIGEWALGLMIVLIAAVNGHILAESRRLERFSNLALTLVLLAAVGAIYWFFKPLKTNDMFLLLGLCMSLLVAPFLRLGVGQGAVWLWCLRLGLAFLLAAIVGMVFAGGLSAIVATLNYLLGIPVAEDTYLYIWLTASCLVAPLYWLAMLPARLDETMDIADHHNTLLERGLSVLVNFVIVPLVTVYALIIHVYAAKIAVLANLPKGEIGTIVTLFVFAATAVWLISWPWRETGTWLSRQYSRHWFWLIPVPTVLLAIAVARRILDYGVTPERYGLAIIALWTAVQFIYLLYRRNRTDMRVVIGTMAALLLLSSFGPWGANGVTAQSQWARLQPLLLSTGLLKDSKIVLPPPNIPDESKLQLRSMLQALGDVHGLGPLLALLPEADRPQTQSGRFNTWGLTSETLLKLGLGEVWQTPSSLNYTAQMPIELEVPSGMKLIGPYLVHNTNVSDPPASANEPQATFRTVLAQNTLHITGRGLEAQVAISRVVDVVKAARQTSEKSALMLDIGEGAQIAIYEVYGDNTTSPTVSSLSFWLLLPAN